VKLFNSFGIAFRLNKHGNWHDNLMGHITNHSMNSIGTTASSAMASIRNTKLGWKVGTFSMALLFGPFALKGMIKCLGKNSDT